MSALFGLWTGYALALVLLAAIYYLLRNLQRQKRQLAEYQQKEADQKRRMIEALVADYENTTKSIADKKGKATQTIQQYLAAGELNAKDPLYQNAKKLNILPPKKKVEFPKWLIALISFIFVTLAIWVGNLLAK
jgi:cbb3-type cytochrome oxidase subunit 3